MKYKIIKSKKLKLMGIKNIKNFNSILNQHGFDSNNLLK